MCSTIVSGRAGLARSVKDTVHIDGSQGEGGGQTLRTAIALSAIEQRPVHITKIRAGRPRPGLRRQHLAAARAVAEICQGVLEGAELNASELYFEPGPLKAGDYHFSVGTAGSACLVFQTVLWPLALAKGSSRVVFEGGTHNPGAPCFDFVERCFLPIIGKMGVGVDIELERHGFVPAGGGRFVARIQGGCELSGIELHDKGEMISRQATALVCNLPGTIAIRELHAVRDTLGWKNQECLPKVIDDADGPGNVLLLEIVYQELCEMVTAVGERHLSAEDVALRAAHELERYLSHGAPVGAYLADQLMLPFALAGAGRFRTGPLSRHARTNIDLLSRFLDTHIEVSEQGQCTMLTFTRP